MAESAVRQKKEWTMQRVWIWAIFFNALLIVAGVPKRFYPEPWGYDPGLGFALLMYWGFCYGVVLIPTFLVLALFLRKKPWEETAMGVAGIVAIIPAWYVLWLQIRDQIDGY